MGESKVNHLLFMITFILISMANNTICKRDNSDCVYTVYIRTGSVWKGGTDSIITLTLYDAAGHGIRINNIETWGGLMGSNYDYFERSNLDIFSGRGPCLTGPPCEMNITSDGSGSHHGWYCNYVEVTSSGADKPCAQQEFEVEQWVATDAWPYELTAIRNYCDNSLTGRRDGGHHVILEANSSSLVRGGK
ncbi:Lipase/lipooxygenase, PLAT/LH2 [Artemisia annua]|uniref:Lipase/lipooxygenase, PLAT/LH2 n=1 Tax=Artemisia annua TaxID=35608 RepID=A0A2U1MU37_ARTAN|nr:Lipase/lipooxygenase, PLAT/LH2 [Artemisia annua]